MKHTPSQTVLRIISILQFLNGLVFILLLGLVIIGMVKAGVSKQLTIDGDIIFDMVKLLINAVLLFIGWYIFKEVSKDASKHNSALTITLVIIAFEIFNFITSLGVGVPRNLAAMIVSIVINMVSLFFIAKVKQSYTEYRLNNRDDSQNHPLFLIYVIYNFFCL